MNKPRIRICIAALRLVVGIVVTAPGALARAESVLFTGALNAAANNGFSCAVTNVGKKDAEVMIQIIAPDGSVRASFSGPVTLPPGRTTDLTAASSPGPGYVYCRVTGIPKRTARVTMCVQETIGGPCISTATLP